MEVKQLQYHLNKGNINRDFYEAYLQELRNTGEIEPEEYAAGINYKAERSFAQKKAEAMELLGIKPV